MGHAVCERGPVGFVVVAALELAHVVEDLTIEVEGVLGSLAFQVQLAAPRLAFADDERGRILLTRADDAAAPVASVVLAGLADVRFATVVHGSALKTKWVTSSTV